MNNLITQFMEASVGKNLDNNENSTKMPVAKIVWLLIDIIGIPASIYAFILNIGTLKGDVVFILSAIYLLVRIVAFSIKAYQEMRMNQFDIEDRLEEKRKKR